MIDRQGVRRLTRRWMGCWVGLVMLALVVPAMGLITGTVGHDPVTGETWPAGAVEVANLNTRMAWWDGPLGGNCVFLYRGDEADLQVVLEKFARIHWPELKLVVHEGRHESFFLQRDKDTDNAAHKADAHVDWELTLWDPESWHRMFNNPTSMWDADDPRETFRHGVAPPTLDVWVAGEGEKGLDWSKIKVPAGITVVDGRAVGAGYKREDGTVLKGDVFDLLTSKPVAGAQVTVVTYTPKGEWVTIAGVEADAEGRFELKNVPAEMRAVRVGAKGYATRDLGYQDLGEHGFMKYTVMLAKAVTLKGIVRDPAGKPIAGAKVRGSGVVSSDGRGYRLAKSAEATSDANGEFEIADLPRGYTQLYASHEKYNMLNIFKIYNVPATEVVVEMSSTGVVKGKVVGGKGEMHVSINPPGKSEDWIGKWGGSMQVKEDGTFEFSGVPAGEYVITTSMDPTLGEKDPLAKKIMVKGGGVVEVELNSARK